MFEAQVLAVDPSTLSHDQRLDSLEQLQLLRAAVDVQEQCLLAALAAADTRAEQWVREEVSTVLRIAPQTAAGRLDVATTLATQLPATLAAMREGRVTMAHARALVESIEQLDDTATARVQRRVLARCDGKSVAEFRAHCRRAALAADTRGAQERHESAVEQRSVSFSPELDGMANISAYLPAADVAKIRQRVEACAASLSDEDRTAAQKRADVFVDLLLTDALEGPRGKPPRPIQVIASMSTLQGHCDAPGEVNGEPVAAAVVRQLANEADTWWRPVLVDDDGYLLAVGAYTYRPSAALRRQVELRDRSCRFVGCRRRAVTTEIDHIVPFGEIDGLTVESNLHCLCKRHHRLKHEAGWHVTRRPDGTTVWRSPTGRHYEKPPDPYPSVTAGFTTARSNRGQSGAGATGPASLRPARRCPPGGSRR